MRVKFFGHTYLKLSVSRSFVFQNDSADSADAAEMVSLGYYVTGMGYSERQRNKRQKQPEILRHRQKHFGLE